MTNLDTSRKAGLLSQGITFPDITFPDMDAETLAREEDLHRVARAGLVPGNAWGEFLRKIMPNPAPQPTMRLLRASQA